VAFVLLWRGSGTDLIPWGTPSFSLASTSLPFIIALMGWMPTAVDLSTWNSIWTVERIRESGYKPSMRETILEFHLGYWISALLAVVFVLIGAIGLYGKQQQFSGSASGFAYQLVELYSTSIGKWARLAIATSAFSIMLGTFIAVLDGYSRSIDHSLQLLKAGKSRYRRILVATTLGGFVVILLTGGRMKFLVDLATTVSFLVAPLIAAGNLYLVTGNRIPRVDQPGKLLRFLAWMGLIFLGMFSFWFVLSSA
jgi:Mn2+/Fe2+ NRAMP family transporter